MFRMSTPRSWWLFVRQSELMQICKLFPFVKCQKNTCKSLALALSCQLALLKGGDKWQSIKQHAFKERGDLFQNCSFRGSFNNISKTGSQPHFFPLAVMNTQLCYSSLPPPVKWTGITKLMKKTSIFFFFSLSFSFLFNCFSLFLSFFFWIKSKTKKCQKAEDWGSEIILKSQKKTAGNGAKLKCLSMSKCPV